MESNFSQEDGLQPVANFYANREAWDGPLSDFYPEGREGRGHRSDLEKRLAANASLERVDPTSEEIPDKVYGADRNELNFKHGKCLNAVHFLGYIQISTLRSTHKQQRILIILYP